MFSDPFAGAFTLMPVFISLFFIVFIGVFVFSIVRGVRTWNYNNAQPVLAVVAKVVTKRADVTNHIHNTSDNGLHHHSTSTAYYVTFEVESGDRLEFQVKPQEYGMLVEEDLGKLTFQGSRYLGFQRSIQHGKGS